MTESFISQAALQDLDQIFECFFSRNVEASEAFVTQFKKKCQYLVQFPRLGRSYAELRPNLRGVPLMNYVILYQVIDGGVEVVGRPRRPLPSGSRFYRLN